MTSSASGQYVANSVFWLATQAGKMEGLPVSFPQIKFRQSSRTYTKDFFRRNWRHNCGRPQYLDLPFYDGHKKKMTVRTSQQLLLHSILAFTLRKTKLFAGLSRSVLEETVPSVFRTQDLGHSFFQCGPPGRWLIYISFSRFSFLTVSTFYCFFFKFIF